MAERRTRAGRKRNLAIRHRQDLEPDRWHDKEIHRHHRFQVIVQERPPGLGWRLAVPDHVLADAGLADVDAELQEFAVNVRRSRRVEETRCTLDFPWLYPPFPASCPVRSINGTSGTPPSQIPPCRFPAAGSSSR